MVDHMGAEPSSRPALIGRDAVIELLTKAIEDTLAGTGQLVLVAGEPVLRDGRCTRVNKAEVLAELAASLRLPLRPEEERRQHLARDVFPYVRHFYDGWLDASAREPFYRPSARY